MYVVNRSAVILKPRQPFVDWANSLPGETKVTLEELRADPTVTLLPESERPGAQMQYVQRHCSELFSYQLWSWHTDEAGWPAKRDWRVFQTWFDIETCEEVFDLVEKGLTREEA